MPVMHLYSWELEPPQPLLPRFSPRHTVDKMLYALQYTPGPATTPWPSHADAGGAFREYLLQ